MELQTNTEAKLGVKYFKEAKKEFMLDVHNLIQMDKIPPDLVMNFDQTVPVDIS